MNQPPRLGGKLLNNINDQESQPGGVEKVKV